MFPKSDIDSKLETEILFLLTKMSETRDDPEKYGTLEEQLSKLYKLKAENKPKRITPDTVLVVAANIFGILWLARYERENVIRGREAMKHVMKPR